jgi:predicted metal-dependent phosphoesterase TrpH
MGYRFDLHVHSCYSNDTNTSIKELLENAIKKGLAGIAVTDHDTLEGAKAAAAYVKEHKLPLKVILGQELKTKEGELLALFIHKELKSKELLSAIKEIRMQGGLVVLPHPYRNKPAILEHAELFDFVEVHNSRSYKKENKQAKGLAERYNLKQTVGSDAHFVRELASSMVVFKTPKALKLKLMGGEYRFEIRQRSPFDIFLSKNMTGYVRGGIPYLWRKFWNYFRG